MGEDQGSSYEDLKKNVYQLINLADFSEFIEYLKRLYFDIGNRKLLGKICRGESEMRWE
jgi:hypothetical protein